MHVIGVYEAKIRPETESRRVFVEVRPTEKPLVLVLTSYMSVDWQVRLAADARIKKVIVSGYFEQALSGVPPSIPVENRSYYPTDASRRKGGWFWAFEWNRPQWREMARNLNESTGLAVATFQGAYQGLSFVVDRQRGRGFGQADLKRRPQAPPDPRQIMAASWNAELHFIGIGRPDNERDGRPTDVIVQPTHKPVVLFLSSYDPVVWNVRKAPNARLSAVLVGSPAPQEVEGLPPEVPVHYFCPDGSAYFFDRTASPRDGQSFFASRPNTGDYRRMVEKLNDLTGLLISSFQRQDSASAFVVDGLRRRELVSRRPAARREMGCRPADRLADENQSRRQDEVQHRGIYRGSDRRCGKKTQA